MAHDQFLRRRLIIEPDGGEVPADLEGAESVCIRTSRRTHKKGPRFTRTDMMRAQRARYVEHFTRPRAKLAALRSAEAAGRAGPYLTLKEKLRLGITMPEIRFLKRVCFRWAKANPGLSDPDRSVP